MLNADEFENGKRSVCILKPCAAYREYLDMINYYCIRAVAEEKIEKSSLIKKILAAGNRSDWENIGGQLIKSSRIKSLLNDIEEERISSWDEIHDFYISEAKRYRKDLLDHVFSSLKDFMQISSSECNDDSLEYILNRSIEINTIIAERTYESRSKDYQNPYRNMSYTNDLERDAVIGRLDDNSFIKKTREDARVLEDLIRNLL